MVLRFCQNDMIMTTLSLFGGFVVTSYFPGHIFNHLGSSEITHHFYIELDDI